MKYVFLALAGAADEPLRVLDGRTPLEVARLPQLARLAERGQVGQVFPLAEETPPTAFSAGAVSMALFGCDPGRYFQGQGPLEAVAAQVPLGARDIAFCGSFVASDGTNLVDPAPPTSGAEMRQLAEALQARLGSPAFGFFAGAGNRAVLRWQSGERDVSTTPPTRLVTGPLAPQLPEGDGAEQLQQVIWDSVEILDAHEINRQRRGEGKPLLNTLWPWGQGEAVALPTLLGQYGVTGVARTTTGLVRGLALAVGLRLVSLTAYDTEDFTTDAAELLDGLDAGADLAFFHTLAPSRAGQSGDVERKVHVLEQIDRLVVGPLVEGLQKRGQRFRLLATPVHQTLLEGGGKHTARSVPFLLYDSTRENDNNLPWQERVLPDTRVIVREGHRLLERLLR